MSKPLKQSMLARWAASRWVYVWVLVLGLMQAAVFDFAFDSSLKWRASLLSYFSLGGFLLLMVHLTPRRAALCGYAFGLGVFGWGLNWIYISMAQFGGAPLLFAVLANVAVVAYLAGYWALTGYLITRLGKTRNQRLLLAAPVIALLEWVRSVFLIGFPWLSIGYGLVDTPWANYATIGGVFFVSFVVVLALSALMLDVPKRFRAAPLLIFFALGLFWPPDLLLDSKAPTKGEATVTLIQGNMPVITEYDDARMTQNLVKYMKLTDEALAEQTPDVMIWPESAIPYFYIEARDFLGSIYDEQRTKHFDLITGVPHGDWTQQDTIYNSILLQRADDPAPQFYSKQHLLPFGEYLPFRRVFAFFKDFVEIPMSDFARGEVVQEPFDAGGLKFAPSICFEAVFGNEIRQNANNADVLLNISNDAWFGKSKAQAQHLNIARMRAIENQKMLVRATNDGLTAIVSPRGEVLQSLPPFNDGVLTENISGHRVTTLYSWWGDSFVIVISALLFMLVLFLRKSKEFLKLTFLKANICVTIAKI